MIGQLKRQRRVAGDAGFTLIELLVVIVILGVLAAVVVFSVRGVSDKGQSAANGSDAQTLRTAEEAFCASHGYYAPSLAVLQTAGLVASTAIDSIQPATGPCGPGTVAGQPSGFQIVCPQSPTNNCAGAGTQGAVSGGTMVLAVGSPLPANTLPINPATTSSGTSHPLDEAMFNGLLAFDSSGNVVPDLASAVPSVANGGIVNNTATDGSQDVSFTLRPNMVWQDSTPASPQPITNADVVFSFTQSLLIGQGRTAASMGPALGFRFTGTASAPTGEFFDSPPGGSITTFSVGGQPLGVRFHFLFPYAPFLRQLNVTEAPIIPQHVYAPCALVGGNGSLTNQGPAGTICPQNLAPVGSGPFMFSSFTTSALTLVRNPQYFKAGLPYLSKLVLVPSTSPQTGLAAARGTANSYDTGSVAASALSSFTGSSSYNVVPVARGSGGGNCINTIAFNMWQPTNGPAGDPGATALPEWASGLPGSNTTGDKQSVIVSMPANAPYDNPILSSPLVRKAMFEGFNRAQAAVNDTGVAGAVNGPKGTARLADSIYDSNLPIAYSPTTFPGGTGASLGQPTVAQANADLDAAGWDGGLVADGNGSHMVRTWGNHPTFAQQANLGLTPGTQLKLDVNYNGGSTPVIASQFISDMLAIGIDVFDRGPRPSNSVASTINARNFETALVSYCDGDDPVVGVQRQYVSTAIPVGFAANTSGYRDQGTTPGDGSMDGLWYQANRVAPGAAQTTLYGQIQALALNPASPSAFSEIYVDETVNNRVTRSVCTGLNNQNTGLFVETASCP